MAGTYGHELTNHKNSLGIYELSRIRRCNAYREIAARHPAIPAEAVLNALAGRASPVGGITGDYRLVWNGSATDALNAMGGIWLACFDIRFERVLYHTLEATMPVDRTKQPFGLLHGGASVVLASIGSVAGYLCTQGSKRWWG